MPLNQLLINPLDPGDSLNGLDIPIRLERAGCSGCRCEIAPGSQGGFGSQYIDISQTASLIADNALAILQCLKIVKEFNCGGGAPEGNERLPPR
jgi:hypothetical protein